MEIFNSVPEEVLVAETIKAVRKNNSWEGHHEGYIAQWVATNYPVSIDTPSFFIQIFEDLEEYLFFQGLAIPQWLMSFDGRPALVATSTNVLTNLQTDEPTQEIIYIHEEKIYESIGIGPREVTQYLIQEIECSMMGRDVDAISSNSLRAIHSIVIAAQEQRSIKDDPYIRTILYESTSNERSILKNQIIALEETKK